MESGLFLEKALKLRLEENYDEYILALREGSKNNNEECSYLLGTCYLRGEYGLEDCKEAFKLFENNQHHFKSIAMLAFMYNRAIGCKIDYIKSDELGKKILSSPHADHHSIGFCYYHGFGIDKADNKKAYDEFLMSVLEKNDDESQVILGIILLGDNQTQDAYSWFYKSAMLGNPQAFERVGDCLYYGLGVEMNIEESLKWFKKSFKVYGNYRCGLKYILRDDISGENIDTLINTYLSDYYFGCGKYYDSWYFYNKSKQPIKHPLNAFQKYIRCYKATLTLLCISKYSGIFPKDIWILLAKYIWKTKHDETWEIQFYL